MCRYQPPSLQLCWTAPQGTSGLQRTFMGPLGTRGHELKALLASADEKYRELLGWVIVQTLLAQSQSPPTVIQAFRHAAAKSAKQGNCPLIIVDHAEIYAAGRTRTSINCIICSHDIREERMCCWCLLTTTSCSWCREVSIFSVNASDF